MSVGFVISNMLSKMLKTNVMHYCQLESASGEHDLVTEEGGLVTAFEIKGTFATMGDSAFIEQLEGLVDGLSAGLKRPGHRIQFVFRRDPMNSREAIRRSIDGAIKTMRRLNLDLEAMVTERGDLLTKKTVLETCHMVISTYPSALHNDILKEATKERAEKASRSGGLKPGAMAQSVNMEMPGVEMIHSGFVNQVVRKLSEKLSIRRMDNHELLHEIRKQITQYDTSDKWRASLPNDPIPTRLVEEAPVANDMSHVLWPTIAHQLFSRSPRIHEEDPTLVDIGDWVIAPVLVDQRPQNPKTFADLFSSIDRNVPWQMSLCIDSGHDKIVKMVSSRKTFASMVAFASSENKLIRDAGIALLTAAETDAIVTAKITFSTWGKSLEECRRNRSKMKTAVEAWGQTIILEERGDAIELWLNTLPGFSGKHLATPLPLTVTEALSMAPITRPVSPWSDGTMIYRTIDEKAFPYLPGSNLQNANMELVFAPPGYGKSFYLAAANMGLITKPGNEILPRIGIVDIGYSSAMFVNMVRDSLPENKKHLAQSFRLEMDRRYAVNFFDTPLGCQTPLKVDREFVVNMMTLLCTPAGTKHGVSRLPELVSNLVDAMYEYFSDDNNPNIYEPGMDATVDKLLDDHLIRVVEGTSWWKVVLVLHEKGFHNEAARAQRYAVPTLNDATTVLSSASSIRDVYGSAMVDNGNETLISFLKTMIISAVNDYPILSQPTVFTLGEARIVSMDLMSVARDGSAQADKKTAVMYMLARQIICRDYYRKVEYTIPEIPNAYKAYHRKVIEKDEAIPKKFCMDEFHRTSSSPDVRNQAMVDIREGRKYNVHVSLLSQLLEDFDPKMIKVVNNIIILSKGASEMGTREIRDMFAPSPDAMKAMSRYLTGPGPEGSSMLYIGQLKSETAPRIEQVLRLTLGPTEMWAYSTTPDDVSLRQRLSEKVGLSNALMILSKAFPNGSAQNYLSKMMLESDVEMGDIDENHNIFDLLAEEVMEKHANLIDYAKIKVAVRQKI